MGIKVCLSTLIPYCKPSKTTFLGLNFSRILLHRQNEMNAKKIIAPAMTVAILPYGVWF